MSIDDIERITDQAYEMGVGIVMFAGGEPLMKKGLLEIIKGLKNVITVFSLEHLLQ